MVRTRRTYKNNRKILKCMQIENDIITYLNTHLDNNKSIALYGNGGEGKHYYYNASCHILKKEVIQILGMEKYLFP